MFDVYVVWVVDGPVMTTLLQFEEEDRDAVMRWTPDQIVQQAKDAEDVSQDDSYELVAIFTGNEITFIY